MKKDRHHIKKQQVDLAFESEEKARHWNNRFSDFYYDEIVPHFGSLLDETIPDDHSYVIDRLEIDLGTIQMEEFREAFLRKAEEELRRILNKGSISTSGSGLSVDEKNAVTDDFKRGDARETAHEEQFESRDEKKSFRIKNKREQILDSLFHFLDHGVLPWYTEISSTEELEAEILREIGEEKLTTHPSLQSRMQKASIRQRFYFQFSEDFVEEVFNQLYSEERAVLVSLKEELKKQLVQLAKDDSSRMRISQELSKSIWRRVFETDLVEPTEWPKYFVISIVEATSAYLKSPKKESSIFKMLIEDLPPSSRLATYLEATIEKKDTEKESTKSEMDHEGTDSTKKIQDHSSKKNLEDEQESREDPGSRDSIDDKVERSSKKEDQTDEIDTTDESTRERPDKAESGESIDDEASSQPGPGTEEMDTDDEDLKKSERFDTDASEISQGDRKKAELPADSDLTDIEEGRQRDLPEILDEYYLQNAGIILSWPYLVRLFGNLGYLEEKAFNEPRVQQRAVHLLGYIGSGEDQCEEHELVFPKFLCAWPLQMPIIKELELTDEEKDSADEMLGSLIDHWSVLKNTSVEGLRESFFNRDGKLFKEDKQWRLIVEQESYDMLLDRLPFNISMIKLPWMEEILKVDWA